MSTGSELYLQLGSQSSTDNMRKRYQKWRFRWMTVYNKHISSQCNLPAQIEQVQDKYYYHVITK